MNKSEVDRHKMYEHPVPVSPFEDKLTTTTTTKNSDSGISPESLHKLTTDVEAAAGIGNNAAKKVLLRRQLLVEGEYRSNLLSCKQKTYFC